MEMLNQTIYVQLNFVFRAVRVRYKRHQQRITEPMNSNRIYSRINDT